MENGTYGNYFRKLLPYLIVFFSFGLFLIIMVYVIDSYILPGLVHDRETVQVPDLTGKKLGDAENILDRAELKFDVISEQYSAKVPEGVIISQVPAPGKMVKAGRIISLTISKGEQNIKMPNLVGKTQREAKIELMNLGLKPGEITYVFNEDFGADTVINQSVSTGRKINYGSTVNLIISKGSELQVMVPNLVMSDYNNAESILAESGLFLGEVEWKEGDGTFISNTIIGQVPAAGNLVMKNSYVNITVVK